MRNLHIAMIVRLFGSGGGLEHYALRVVQGLLARGHSVTVICQRDDSGLAHQRLRIFCTGEEKGLDKTARLDFLEKETSILLEKHGPFDIVHSQHCPAAGVDVVTFHQHSIKRFSESGNAVEGLINDFKIATSKAYKKRLEQDGRLARSAALRVFVSDICKDDYYRFYKLGNLPWALARCGADPAPALEGTRDQTFTYLFIGKGYRKKGLDTLYKAASLLKDSGLKLKLLVVGMRATTFNKLTATMHGIADVVEFCGFQKDLEPFFARASVIVVPSKCEAFGMSPVEAMLRGVPAVVSRVAGMSETLENGVNGLVVENHLDAVEFAANMRKLQEDPKLLKEMSLEARKLARELSWESTVDATEEAYEKCLRVKV